MLDNKRKIILLIMQLCVAHFSLPAQMKYLSLQEYKVDNVSLVSFSTYSVKVHLRLYNDTSAFAISNISLEIFKGEKLFATGSINDIYIEHNRNSVYVRGLFNTVSNMPILTIIGIVAHPDFSKFFVDASMRVTFPSGDIKHIQRRKVPVGKLLRISPSKLPYNDP